MIAESAGEEESSFLGRDFRAVLRVFWSHKPQQRDAAPWKPSGTKMPGAGKSLITLHLFLWKLLGAAEGSRHCKQRSRCGLLTRLLMGARQRGSPAPHADLALGLRQELLNDMSTQRAGASRRREIRVLCPSVLCSKRKYPC